MRTPGAALHLHEEVLLLALRDDRGTIDWRASHCGYALGGAILAELTLAQRITIAPDRKRLVSPLSALPPGDPLLDESLALIGAASRRRSATAWVMKLGGLRRLYHRVAAGLCRRGILRTAEESLLLIFTRTVYPEIDPRPERALIDRLRRAIFDETHRPDTRTAILLGLLNAAGMLTVCFPRKELRPQRKRIDAICRGELLAEPSRQPADRSARLAADAVRATIEAVSAAVVVACAAAATAAT